MPPTRVTRCRGRGRSAVRRRRGQLPGRGVRVPRRSPRTGPRGNGRRHGVSGRPGITAGERCVAGGAPESTGRGGRPTDVRKTCVAGRRELVARGASRTDTQDGTVKRRPPLGTAGRPVPSREVSFRCGSPVIVAGTDVFGRRRRRFDPEVERGRLLGKAEVPVLDVGEPRVVNRRVSVVPGRAPLLE